MTKDETTEKRKIKTRQGEKLKTNFLRHEHITGTSANDE